MGCAAGQKKFFRLIVKGEEDGKKDRKTENDTCDQMELAVLCHAAAVPDLLSCFQIWPHVRSADRVQGLQHSQGDSGKSLGGAGLEAF